MPTAFLSLPMTCNFDDSGMFREDRRRFYASIIDAIGRTTLSVISPVLNEQWGAVKLDVTDFTSYDVDSIRSADCLVVAATEKLSRDIYLEIGLAVGMRKPVFCFIHEDVWTTYMLNGFSELDLVSLYRYSDEAQAPTLVFDVLSAALRTRRIA